MDQDQIASQLKGNTLRVYWCLIQSSKNPIGPRDIQRKLKFSSPSLAVYHLDKLVEIGLAEKVVGEYHLTKVVDVGVLKQFSRLGVLFFQDMFFMLLCGQLFSCFFFPSLRN